MNKQPVNKWSTIKRLLAYVFKNYKLLFALVLVCILISSAVTVAGSLFLQIVIDSYITPLLLEENPVFDGLLRAIGTMGIVYLAGVVASLLYNRWMVTISQGILKDIRMDMFQHMQKLPIRYFDTHTHGDVMSYYTNDTDTLRQVLSQSIPQMFSSMITIIAVFISMVIMSIPLTVIVLLTLGIMLKTVSMIAGKSGKYFANQQKSLGSVNGYIEEMIDGVKVVKVFCHESEAKDDFDVLNDELFVNADSANKFANILMPIMQNLGNVQYVLIAVVGGFLAIQGIGSLTLGGIAAFLQLSKSFTSPIGQMSQQLNSIVMAIAGAERIFALLDEDVEEDHGYVTLVNAKMTQGEVSETSEYTGMWAWKHPHADGSLTYTKLEGDVRFYDVDFEYDEGKPILHNITLYGEPGQKVAFVGSTGAGKTTITNLINRFYDLADGKIRYDGININKIKKSDLRRSLGVVLQDTNLFSTSIMENIRYGKLDASDDEVIAAAKLANAHDFIMRLPNGYQSELSGNGANLSQGQRQLLSIARAAVANPPVMILDEATSSIDTRTEALVQQGMDQLMHGRTVFVIAHRLSTIKNADAIMVMDHGRIIERGNHEKLIKENGQYYQLYTGKLELD